MDAMISAEPSVGIQDLVQDWPQKHSESLIALHEVLDVVVVDYNPNGGHRNYVSG